MRIQRIVLENHCDISVFGGNVVHQLIADKEFAFGNLLKAGHHTKRGRFSAAGGAYQNDKFFILNYQVKVINSGNTARIYLIDMS